MTRVAIIGNCQVLSLSNAVQAMAPTVSVVQIEHIGMQRPLPESVRAASEAGAEAVLILDESLEEARESARRIGYTPQLVPVPGIYFNAFHPDSGYGFHEGQIIPNPWGGHWSPRLAAWCFTEGLPVEQALRLYTSDAAFEALGYFDATEVAVRVQKESFDRSGLDFDRWYWAVKRRGVFMHGLNHPRIIAVMLLIEQVLDTSLGVPVMPAASLEGAVVDPLLTSAIWAVHDPVARYLGVPPLPAVRFAEVTTPWEVFVRRCYTAWADAGLATPAFQVGAPVPPEAAQALHAMAEGAAL